VPGQVLHHEQPDDGDEVDDWPEGNGDLHQGFCQEVDCRGEDDRTQEANAGARCEANVLVPALQQEAGGLCGCEGEEQEGEEEHEVSVAGASPQLRG